MNHWAINVDKLSPRIPIARVLDLNNQAFTCFGELCHRDLKYQEIRLYTAKHNLFQILTQKLAISTDMPPAEFRSRQRWDQVQ